MYPTILIIAVSWQRQHESGTLHTIHVLTQSQRFTDPPEYHVHMPLESQTSTDELPDLTCSVSRASMNELGAVIHMAGPGWETVLEN